MSESNIHIGFYIKDEYVDKCGLRRKFICKKLNMKYTTLHQLLHGQRRLSPVCGLRLAEYFSKPSNYFLQKQLDMEIQSY